MKKVILSLIVIFTAIASVAQTTFTDTGGNTYLGKFIDTNFTGQGECAYKDGSKFSGFWKNGEYQSGKFIWANGDQFDGYWLNGKRTSLGSLTLSNGEKYSGRWIEDQLTEGRWLDAKENLIYEGAWKNGVFDGKGKLFTNDESFDGTFLNGKKNKGVLKVKIGGNTLIYDGSFDENEFYKGKIIYPDGSYYEGKVKNRMPDYGILKWVKDGKVIQSYRGNWSNGLKDGIGTFVIYGNEGIIKKRYDGVWGDGELVIGELFTKGDTIYNGKFSTAAQIEKALNGDIKSMFDLGSFCLQNADTKNGLEWLEKCDALNYGPACYLLSSIYMQGTYVAKNEQQAKQYLAKSLPLLEAAANKNDQNAMMLLGYYKVTVGDKTGIEWLEKTVALNNSDAMMALGSCYQLGSLMPKDMDKAIQLYKMAAQVNNAEAMYVLGYLLYAGVEVPKNETEGLKWLNMAAETGYTEAYYVLGNLFETEKKGYEYFEKGALLGHPGCMYRASQYVKQGWIGKEYALRLLESAARNKNIDALLNLGSMYENGNSVYSVYIDCNKAADYYETAGDLGNRQAIITFSKILVFSGCQKNSFNYTRAVEKLNKWMDMGFTPAMNILGEFYKNGYGGLPKNEFTGFSLYKNAADKGDIALDLMYCYRVGVGVKKNKQLEAYWQKKYDEQEQKRKGL